MVKERIIHHNPIHLNKPVRPIHACPCTMLEEWRGGESLMFHQVNPKFVLCYSENHHFLNNSTYRLYQKSTYFEIASPKSDYRLILDWLLLLLTVVFFFQFNPVFMPSRFPYLSPEDCTLIMYTLDRGEDQAQKIDGHGSEKL